MSFFDDKDGSLPQDVHSHTVTGESELNDIWRSLLGVHDGTQVTATNSVLEMGVHLSLPHPVAADPWAELLQSQGIELVDLQQHRPQTIQVSFSEQEVEQALQCLQEQ